MPYRTMFWRALLTATSLLVVSLAVFALDCASAVLDLFANDPLGVCAAMGSLGLDGGIWVGAALLLFGLLAIVAIWTVRPVVDKKAQLEATNSLFHNLERLSDVGTQIVEIDDEISTDEIKVARLTRRLEAVELAVDSAATPSREVTQQWMTLLVEANDLHNKGILPTGEFKVINTRLLDLFASPRDTGSRLSGAGSTPG